MTTGKASLFHVLTESLCQFAKSLGKTQSAGLRHHTHGIYVKDWRQHKMLCSISALTVLET